MGMKALIVAGSPTLPRDDLARLPIGTAEASRLVAESVLPELIGARVADGNLSEDCYPHDKVFAGTFGDSWLVASDHDSLLTWQPGPERPHGNYFRVFMHSVVDTAGFTYWGFDGTERDFAGSCEDGVAVDSGDRLAFEQAAWSGTLDPDGEARALWNDEMPFNPMDLGEEALRAFFGFIGEGMPSSTDLDGFEIVMHGFELLDAAPAEATRHKGLLGRLFGR